MRAALVIAQVRGLSVAAVVTLALAPAARGDSHHEPFASRAITAPIQRTPRLAVFRTVASDRPGYPHYDIVIARVGSRGLRVVAGDALRRGVRPVLFGRVSWSPDGRRMAFAADLHRNAGFATDIYTMRADGSHQRRLIRHRDASEPVWSPTGRTIVFARRGALPRNEDEPLTSALWEMRPDGSDQRRFTHSGDQVAEAPGSFMPDGSQFAFTRGVFSASGRPDTKASGLFVAQADGSGERRLIEDGGAPAYSPSGRRIAFVSGRDRNGELNYGDSTTPAAELYVMNSDGSHRRRLTRTRSRNEAAPSWLPNGRRIAYQRGKQIENAEGTIVMQINPDGTCARRLLADPHLDTWYASPTWRPGRPSQGGSRLRC